MEELLLRPEAAARMLGISRSRCYAMLAAGALPAIRLGRTVRVPRAELERWIADQVTNGVASTR